jgi:2-keto-3-deoxy-L-rhamnonate aldolase RhmA
MITAKVKETLASGGTCYGGWLTLGSPAAAELMGELGFDVLIMEGEHGALEMSVIQAQLMALKGSSAVAMVRLPWNDPVQVKVALDVGVRGIMFPMINSGEEALQAVRACRYPPEGVRGIGPGRCMLYGLNRQEYMKTANEDLLVFIIIEHEQAMQHLDEILSVPGIDGAFFGFADYAGSLGLTGQNSHPRVLEARARVLEATRRHGVAAGHAAGSLAQAQELAALGFRLLTLGSDAAFIMEGGRAALAAMRR